MRYYTYSDHLKAKYGEKVYKLPINIKASCPNRDGTKGVGGCIFCGEKGSGLENLPAAFSVTEQLEKNIEYIGKRYGADKYIAYFQNFTNTYVPYEEFMDYAKEAAAVHDVVQLAFSTRPDCIPEGHLTGLKELSKKTGKDISIELGLQTVNYHTLKKVNRGHGLAEFIDAALRIKSYGFELGVHVILNLPWDDREDVAEAAKIISSLKADHVKLHSLYIEKNTLLSQMYENKEFEIAPLEEYVERAILFLELLNPNIAIQRIASRAPSRDTTFCNWGTGWWKIRDQIEGYMVKRDTGQGAKFTYLDPCMAKEEKQDKGDKSSMKDELIDGQNVLVLWDIDGTLMHCGSDGTKALNKTFEDLFGIENAMAGAGIGSAMDSAIIKKIMTYFSIKADQKDQIMETYVQNLRQILKNNPAKRILPGVKEILTASEQNPKMYSAILTSNFRVGAEEKLKSVELLTYFEIGGFGDDEGEKWHAAEVAVETAETQYNCKFSKQNIYIIGDSVYDVECAKRLGYKSIAVSTGWMDKEALERHEPDYLFDDLGDVEQVMKILTGE